MNVREAGESGAYMIYHVTDPDHKAPRRVQMRRVAETGQEKWACAGCNSRSCAHVEAVQRMLKARRTMA